jgi:hypothetical protein
MGFVARKQREEHPRRIRNTALARQKTHSRPLFHENSPVLDTPFASIGSIQAAGAHRGARPPKCPETGDGSPIFLLRHLHNMEFACCNPGITRTGDLGRAAYWPNQSNRRIN